MKIGALIGIIIAIVVGVNLIGPITKTLQTATSSVTTTLASGITTTTTPAYSSAVIGFAGILPIVFVAIIILGAVAYMGFGGNSEEKTEKTKKSVEVKIRTNSGKLISFIIKASESMQPYINNLDELLGIKTINKDTPLPTNPLTLLNSNELWINDQDYDWYITTKQENENVFKVIGLNKTDEANNVVYILGSRIPEEDLFGNRNMKPFLIKVPYTRTSDEIKSPKELFTGYYTK